MRWALPLFFLPPSRFFGRKMGSEALELGLGFCEALCGGGQGGMSDRGGKAGMVRVCVLTSGFVSNKGAIASTGSDQKHIGPKVGGGLETKVQVYSGTRPSSRPRPQFRGLSRDPA